MARKTKKTTRKAARRAPKKAVRMPKCCDCPGTAARKQFKIAKTCSAKANALEKLKRIVADDSTHMPKGQKSLLFRDLLRKQQQVQDTCSREEASDSSRFNGLGRVRRRAKRRRR